MSFAQVLSMVLHLYISIFCIFIVESFPHPFLFATATLTQNLGTTLHLHVIKFATFLLYRTSTTFLVFLLKTCKSKVTKRQFFPLVLHLFSKRYVW